MVDVARMWRLDVVAAPDVDADVAEVLEEDEIAGLELVLGDVDAVVPLRRREVRERDADLGEDVLDETGAVERVRAGRAPHVRPPEVLHCDGDDS